MRTIEYSIEYVKHAPPSVTTWNAAPAMRTADSARNRRRAKTATAPQKRRVRNFARLESEFPSLSNDENDLESLVVIETFVQAPVEQNQEPENVFGVQASSSELDATHDEGATSTDEESVAPADPEDVVVDGASDDDEAIEVAELAEGAATAGSGERAYGTTTGGSLRHAEFERLFREWRANGDDRLRDRLILMNRGLVAYLARRFSERGEMSDDLMQQGLIGLINALDSFDPDRGARFVTFATPTILGEMRRYLRDRTWGVRVPRRLHELHNVINHRIEALTQQFDRSPTYAEIARSLGLELEEVIEALELFNTAEPISIDEADSNSEGEGTLSISDRVGAPDADLESLNDHAILRAALEQLEPRERQVLEAVYFQGHSQLTVAKQMKVSQMNISRLQRRALAHLRELMNSGDL